MSPVLLAHYSRNRKTHQYCLHYSLKVYTLYTRDQLCSQYRFLATLRGSTCRTQKLDSAQKFSDDWEEKEALDVLFTSPTFFSTVVPHRFQQEGSTIDMFANTHKKTCLCSYTNIPRGLYRVFSHAEGAWFTLHLVKWDIFGGKNVLCEAKDNFLGCWGMGRKCEMSLYDDHDCMI